MLILLGEPAEVTKVPPGVDLLALRGQAVVPSSRNEVGEGGRTPEVWIFKGERFGGEAKVEVDSSCMGPKTDDFRRQLDRQAAAKVVNPNIDYRFTAGKEGHLVKLVDLMPKPSAAQTLLQSPRQDFPVAIQVTFLKAQGGGTAVLGLVHGVATDLAAGPAGPPRVIVCAQAENDQGRPAAFAEQETTADVRKDGTFVTTFRMGLKPGKYALRAGVLDPKTNKGSLADLSVEVPDFNRPDLTTSIVMLRDAQDRTDTASDPTDPYAAFTLGRVRLIPEFGYTLAKGEPLWFFYQYYDAKVDEKTTRAAVSVSASVSRGTATLANAPEQPYDTPVGGTTVGPTDLSAFGPGKYKMHIRVVDNVARKEVTEEVPFEVAR